MSAAMQSAALLPLRQEIGLFPGPPALDGSPSWTLHDPSAHRFYRIGWPEFEILSRWGGASAGAIAKRIRAETTLAVEDEDVEEFGRFLLACDLLHVSGPQATAGLVGKAERRRESVGRWLLHNYLFMRIPLLRPDAFLTAAYPLIAFVYTRAFAAAIVLIGLAGLYLVARQWDTFLATFVDMFTVQGLVWFAVTLAAMKVVHELGHAFTAKRFGCRVPSMGLALLVLVPMLYTDVNETWKLTSRRQRLAVGLAGVTAELGCAAIALCAWGFLPAGPARSVAFLVATSIWLATVLINLSPFMRFDGYYVLSDWLEVPNLHARAFAMAQWWMREKLFGFGDPVPEDLPPHRRTFMVAFGFATWIYRFILFVGIAVLVYHFAFKLAGVIMMVVEVVYFIVRPIWLEAKAWWSRRRDIRLNRRTVITMVVLAMLIGLVFVPWRSGVTAPAVLRSSQHVDVFVPEFGARVAEVSAAHGNAVEKGRRLVRLTSPDIDYRLGRTKGELDTLEWQMGSRGLDAALLARSQVTEQEYQAALAEYRALSDQKRRLDVVTPIDGVVVDVADGLEAGTWMPAKARLMSIVDATGVVVEAYVDESDLDRLAEGDSARFIGEADSRIDIPLRVTALSRASTRLLTEPALASVNGGPITVRTPKQNELVPDRTIYQIKLTPAEPQARPERVVRGTVILRGEAVSLAVRTWRAVLAVLIRESGA
ncbi:HlyD family efflux transporter periplasmic adaptor subunit [Xanthobacteraceae bacterium Astr-EGSB]|uniref:HlyD family efflux transporter periplasmic adaptor subunit n=1 Tax=Astrobacterium formosum TaxID=3069710 RepID=UPI0027B38F00|nr:HlyD family efflux transporter periplasmic adaptor subunit [Xanthobacteraceae bacterium Astr-EGSB]